MPNNTDLEKLEWRVSAAFRKTGTNFIEVSYYDLFQNLTWNEREREKEQYKQTYKEHLAALEAKISQMMLALLSDPDYRPQNPMYINIQDKPPEEDILHYVFKAFLQHFDYSLQQVMPNHPEEVFAPGEYLRIMGEILREKKQEEIMLLFDHIEGLSTAEQQSINNIICTQGVLYCGSARVLVHIVINNVKEGWQTYKAFNEKPIQMTHDYSVCSIPLNLLPCLLEKVDFKAP